MPCQSHRPTTKMDDVPTDPEGCNSEAKSVEGVDGQDSVRSSIGPPASSLKRSNQKGRRFCQQRRRAGGMCETCIALFDGETLPKRVEMLIIFHLTSSISTRLAELKL